MRLPVQLWLPFLSYSFFDEGFSRDLQRAQQNWKGEHRIWLLPNIKKLARWSIELKPYFFNEVAIPSETFNVLAIVHVDEGGNFFPPMPGWFPDSWQNRIPEDLFKKWLNMKLQIAEGLKEIKMLVPSINKNSAEYKHVVIKLSPGPTFPIEDLNDNGEFSLRWPPKDSDLPSSISPVTENKKRDIAPGDKSFNFWVVGSSPFDKLFLTGIDMDTVLQHTKMKNCSLKKDKEEIASWLGKLTAEGWTNREMNWLAPALEAYGSEHVLTEIEFGSLAGYKIIQSSFKKLLKDKNYNKVFRSPIPIERCFGWLGYFWSELNKMMKKEELAKCDLCGNIISGKKGKKFCGKEENSICFHSRRADDVRRFRKSLRPSKNKGLPQLGRNH